MAMKSLGDCQHANQPTLSLHGKVLMRCIVWMLVAMRCA